MTDPVRPAGRMRGPHRHTIRDALVIARENAPTEEYAARFAAALAEGWEGDDAKDGIQSALRHLRHVRRIADARVKMLEG